jgi:hypothetical protein
MALKPHIYHIVGHTEAHHAATAEDVIEASRIARRAIENAIRGAPDMTADRFIRQRRKELVRETRLLLDAISALGGPGTKDPFTDPSTLTRAVTCGLLDAPQLRNNKFGRGKIRTNTVKGTCVAVDAKGRVLNEKKRLLGLV